MAILLGRLAVTNTGRALKRSRSSVALAVVDGSRRVVLAGRAIVRARRSLVSAQITVTREARRVRRLAHASVAVIVVGMRLAPTAAQLVESRRDHLGPPFAEIERRLSVTARPLRIAANFLGPTGRHTAQYAPHTPTAQAAARCARAFGGPRQSGPPGSAGSGTGSARARAEATPESRHAGR